MPSVIIDSHSHFFSLPFFEGLIKQKISAADLTGELSRVGKLSGIEIPDNNLESHTNKWLDEMKKYNVEKMITFASLPVEAEAVAEAVRLAPGKLVGYTLVNPAADNAAGFIQKSAEMGFRGLLFFPVMHHYRMFDNKIYPALDAAREHNLNIIVHFGLLQVKLRDIIGLPRPFDMQYGNPLDLQFTANRYSDIHFVIPHFGCGFFRETLMLGSLCENVYVDTSSSNSWIKTQPEDLTLASVFKKTAGVFGSERILFGTDSSVFPRGWRNDIYQEQVEAMKEAGFNEDDIGNILSGNINRILKN